MTISRRLRFEVLRRDGHTCRYCGRAVVSWKEALVEGRRDEAYAALFDGRLAHLDHVVPKSKGGSSEIDNLVTACETCNCSKGTRSLASWGAP